MKCREFLNNYFSYYDDLFDRKFEKESLIKKRYFEIRNDMERVVREIAPNDFFQAMSEVMALDAQLQTMLILIEPDLFCEDENYILKLVCSDYVHYYKESYNDQNTYNILHSLQE